MNELVELHFSKDVVGALDARFHVSTVLVWRK